jgi:large subunit ribosomal protein L13
MSTTLVRKEDVQRKWYIVDAANQPLGRTAVTVANILRGKVKADFTPNVDCGDYVIVLNADKAILTGKKLDQKYYRHHSGWIGGLKETKYKTLMAERPEFAMQLAVKGMLPKNTLGRNALTRLKVFAGSEHPHAAQKPEAWQD